MKRLLDGQEIDMTEAEIAALEASRAVVFNEGLFRQELSEAFDAKFETYWRDKGYTDLSDVISHATNPISRYHAEAMGLIEWWHSAWETIVISEESVIEDIIQNLPSFNL